MKGSFRWLPDFVGNSIELVNELFTDVRPFKVSDSLSLIS